MAWNWLMGGGLGGTGDEKWQTHIQKSWDLGGTVCSNRDTPTTWKPSKLVVCCSTSKCVHYRQLNKVAGLWYVSEQGGGFVGLDDLSKSLYRAAVSGCSHPRGGSSGWFFGYTLSTFNTQTQLAIPLSLIWGRTCHSHGSEALGSLICLCPCQQYTFSQDFICSSQANEVAPWVQVSAVKPDDFRPTPGAHEEEELTPESCPHTSTCALVQMKKAE